MMSGMSGRQANRETGKHSAVPVDTKNSNVADQCDVRRQFVRPVAVDDRGIDDFETESGIRQEFDCRDRTSRQARAWLQA